MPGRPALTITLDRAAGVAELRKTLWSARVSIEDLPGWLRRYRRLWSRGSKKEDQPGPWARFYEADLAALEAAVAEVSSDPD